MLFIRVTFPLFATFFLNLYNYANGQGVFVSALFLGEPNLFNTTRDDCNWKRGNERDRCPDKDIRMILFTPTQPRRRTELDVTQKDWLLNSGWESQKQNIILVHGYAGGEETPPVGVLKDAYLNHGEYNVFLVDWGALSQPPCYVAAVHNLKPVARCVAQYFSFLRYSGLPETRTTCVGHSLGAHLCGLLANYLDFRIERIIGLDPARPLIKPGFSNRLDSGDAKSVQVMHTNAGYYGEGGKIGHVDFCVNGGRKQPYCETTSNSNLCSHIWSVCYLAQSIFDSSLSQAEPCPRRCPPGPIISRRSRNQLRNSIGNTIAMGHDAPMNAIGSYCIKDFTPPFCPTNSTMFGDPRCCIDKVELENNIAAPVV
ncbi:Phospholipase A1 member A [Pseudolycoriella hygida]|uniref:Phospholipase A1 member A n=1 Tax=Pseudolycoriella hygida TaxID=35572 RepID=A0A9Q0N9A0_9DIPT|nr:Phospholipase A1 member A [Pseudolycoriella hygida]